LDVIRRQAPHGCEEAARERAIFVEDRVVPVLEQGRCIDLGLLAGDSAAADAAAEYPVYGAVTVECAADFLPQFPTVGRSCTTARKNNDAASYHSYCPDLDAYIATAFLLQ
jgi:hypothetical protein